MDNVTIGKVTMKAEVNVNLTAEQWQLYTRSMKCDNAARSLNARMNKLFRTCDTPEEIQDGMWSVQSMYSSYGAIDTEPSYVIRCIIREVFGENCLNA